MDNHPIGFFDSGAGGLTIWRATRKLLPHESLIYLADAGHAPIGEKSPEEIRDLPTPSSSHSSSSAASPACPRRSPPAQPESQAEGLPTGRPASSA